MRPIKTYDFIVVLKKSSSKIINLISVLMLLIAVCFFSYSFLLQYKQNGFSPKIGLLLLWILTIIGWIIFCQKQQKKGNDPNYRFALMIAAWGWFMHPQTIWLAVVFLSAALLERSIKVAPEYAFDENEIVFNSFPPKKYKWNDVANVVLKFGMLTIDLKSNKIIQGEVNDAVPQQVEDEFNAFCKLQLDKAKAI